MLGDFKVGDLVCYNFYDCDQPIKLMAIVLECCPYEPCSGSGCYYKIQFLDDQSRLIATAIELSPVDRLLSYPDTPQ